jgi:uncharacterized protein (DUF1330 family)
MMRPLRIVSGAIERRFRIRSESPVLRAGHGILLELFTVSRLVAVIRFPTADAIRRFLASIDYEANVRHRDRAFAEVHSYGAAVLMDR